MQIQPIEASGSHFDIGFAVGKAAAARIASALTVYEGILKKEGLKSWDGTGYLEAAEEEFPDFVAELRGMAAGSGQDFHRLFLMNALEEAMEGKGFAACTCIALKGEGTALLGHNEDWYAADARHLVALYVRPAGKPAFVSVTAAPFLAAVGMNERGIAQGVNSLSSTDVRQGVPRMFSARAVLEGRDLQEARKKALNPRRAGGYNHMLVSREGEMGSLETTAGKDDYISYSRWGLHTNHYLSPALSPLEGGESPSSRPRYQRGCCLLEQALGRSKPVEALKEVLRDHANGEKAICRHSREDGAAGTIFSVIFDTKRSRVWAAPGNPCQGDYSLLSPIRL